MEIGGVDRLLIIGIIIVLGRKILPERIAGRYLIWFCRYKIEQDLKRKIPRYENRHKYEFNAGSVLRYFNWVCTA